MDMDMDMDTDSISTDTTLVAITPTIPTRESMGFTTQQQLCLEMCRIIHPTNSTLTLLRL